MQKMHIAFSDKPVMFYNLDVIISVGYRVKSQRGTQFRQWATQRLKDYLVSGYAINEKRLAQKQQEVEYLKTGIRILNRALEKELDESCNSMLKLYSKGLELLDDYDHQRLDAKGTTLKETVYPDFDEYMELIRSMYPEFESGVFARPKDNSFHSSINQIRQSFDDTDLYPSIEEKSANLLYFITKNHSFVDGNKRIAAACFLYFLQKNNVLFNNNGSQIISNETLASLTLFVASSETSEAEIVKRLIISILNHNNP
jgi:prophage maintenance system killer protein